MGELSPETLNRLADAGWSENRLVDISDWERAIRAVGQEPFDCARKFLQNLGNLVVGAEFTRTHMERIGAPFVVGSGTPKPVCKTGSPFQLRQSWSYWELHTAPDEDVLPDIEDYHRDLEDSRVGSPLQCVGAWIMPEVEGHGVFMDSSGRVFMFENSASLRRRLMQVGVSGNDAIEALLTGRPFTHPDGST